MPHPMGPAPLSPPEPELWGGHECTVNRVGDLYRDQTVETGHQDRPQDLDRFAELGIKALRYPVLWERVAPDRPETRDWTWTDERLERIRGLGMRPIAGLLHHGSGPAYTELTAPNFAPLLGEYARAVAERYPWIDDWTPVNEPLTTARFSALYGHWRPHLRDEGAFWLALLNQVDGVRAAMAAIRSVNPAARLIQTEDLGCSFATAAMQPVADFQNDRRWATWDLLAGKVDGGHALWERLAGFGLVDRLRAILDAPCPADVLGVNHYPTSIRFLDHRRERYPGWNLQEGAHADLDAVRILSPQPLDLEGLLRQAWERYGVPVAITESHNGCTRDEQMRWTFEAWEMALRLRNKGVDLCAVTAWALLGNVDWNSLITRQAGFYEPGTFDVRGGTARPTALADMLRRLAHGESPAEVRGAHPVLAAQGWWRRDIRLHHEPHSMASNLAHEPDVSVASGSPLLIVGATGTLGRAFAAACGLRGLAHVVTSRSELDLCDDAGISSTLELHRPWAVVNAGGWVRVDDAEAAAAACMAVNAAGAGALAGACADRDIPCVTFSSDLVFDGEASRAYGEDDEPRPLNVYGRSKQAAERLVAAVGGRQLVIRTAAFFSPFDRYNFAVHVCTELAAGRELRASADHVVSPTYVPDLVNAVLDLLIDGEEGLWHVAGDEALSWRDFAVRIAVAMELDTGLIRAATPRQLGWKAARPLHAALRSERGVLMPSFEDALGRFHREMRARLAQEPAAAEVTAAA